AGNTIRVVGGNFITARPLGVLDGVDLQYTGTVRKVDAEGLKAQLGLGNIVLLSNLGASPTGEIFNLSMEEVAEEVAKSVGADKLIFLTDSQGATDAEGQLLDELTADAAEQLLRVGEWLSPDLKRYLPCAVRASRRGVGRVHIIGYDLDGAVLHELFTHDGVGTVVTRDPLDTLRDAKPDDIGGLVGLIGPLEDDGTLVHRPRELLEREIGRFSVVEHDGVIVGCAALYPYAEDGQRAKTAELACLAVSPEHRRWGYGERLMQHIETKAKAVGVKRLFVLTTRTTHWFIERGFTLASVDELPEEKRHMYNLQRRSKVLMKSLGR
ncbi:MAG: amino-acid N-acetyltransferase, partial [Betaproteobacteria bacterium]|nr:amino-acid N-acetyltransferase [Betaproteobacteria bacterium]